MEEKQIIEVHSDNLDKDGIKRVLRVNSDRRLFDFIQCYKNSADFNVSSGHGFSVYISFPAEVMDAICEEWQRFRRELAAHEAQKDANASH